MSSDLAKVKPLVGKHKGRRQALIPVLQDVQEVCRWLPPAVLEYVSDKLGIPLAEVYGVATFFKSFSLKPRGRHICTVCLGTACHVRGGQTLLDHFERRLGIRVGETSGDQKFTLERVNCLGACALAPLVVVDGQYYSQMDVTRADAVLHKIEGGEAAKIPG